MASYMYHIPHEHREAVAQALRDLPGGLSVHFEQDAAPSAVTGIAALRENAVQLEELARSVTVNTGVIAAMLDMSCRIYPASRSGDDVVAAENRREELRIAARDRMEHVWTLAAHPVLGITGLPFEIYGTICRMDLRTPYVAHEVSLILPALEEIANRVRAAAAGARALLASAERLSAVEPMRKSA